MKLLTWNCNMAFRKKADFILIHEPALVVISESERDHKIDFTKHIKQPHQVLWFGQNDNKGVLILSYDPQYKLCVNEQYNPEFKYVIPIDVRTPDDSFTLFAVWTQYTGRIYDSYVVQAYQAFEFYQALFNDKTIIAGDFNSNVIWDRGCRKAYNHTDLLNLLLGHQMQSLYHVFVQESQGQESSPTLFFQKKLQKPYHVDYIFAGHFWLKSFKRLQVGCHNEYISASDHMPMLAIFAEHLEDN